MGEIEGLAGGEVGLDDGPHGHHRSVGKQAEDDVAPLRCLVYAEESLAGHPAVGYRLLVCLALALAYDDVETVVAEVERLSGALDTVSEDGYLLAFKYFTCVVESEFFACDHVLFYSAEIHFCHSLSVFYLLFLSLRNRAILSCSDAATSSETK